MGELKHDGLAIPSRVVLAHETPFNLGNLRINPATRLVETPHRREILEPRVMQALVALARVGGEIVTRDELIERCWDGRIVSEDAINRVLSRIRHVATDIGEGSFKVETITKVGYRLVENGHRPEHEIESPVAAAAISHRLRGRYTALATAAAISLVAVLAVAIWQFIPRASTAPAIAIVPAVASDEVSRELAQSIALDLSQYPSSAGPLRVVNPGAPASSADYRVEVRTRRTGTDLTGDVTLEASGKSQILWSSPVGVAGASVVDLRQHTVSKLTDVLECLAETREGGARISDEGLALYLKGCGMLSDVDTDHPSQEVLSVWRQLTTTEPKFAPGWAYLAFLEVDAWSNIPTDRRAAVIHDAREQLSRAKSIDPEFPAVFAADANLPEHWLNPAKSMAIAERGLSLHPDSALLHGLRSELLRMVGRTRESIDEASKAMQLKPLSPAERNRYILTMAHAGQTAKAFDQLRMADEIWPGSIVLRLAHYRLDLRYGDPRSALRLLQEQGIGANAPYESALPIDTAWQAFIEARISPTSTNVEKALNAFRARYRRDHGDAWPYLQTLGTYGRVDEAYEALQSDETLDATRTSTDVYFRVYMRPVYSDPRFIRVAYRLGLLDYWKKTGMWPDICRDSHLRYDCRAEAAKYPLQRSPTPPLAAAP